MSGQMGTAPRSARDLTDPRAGTRTTCCGRASAATSAATDELGASTTFALRV